MLTRKHWKGLLIAGIVAATMAGAPAHAFRCGTRLVTEGDPKSKVRRYCGEPVDIQTRVIYRTGLTRPRFRVQGPDGMEYSREILIPDRSYEEVLVEEWTYNFGPRRFMRLVRFENGQVADVRQLGYGYHD